MPVSENGFVLNSTSRYSKGTAGECQDVDVSGCESTCGRRVLSVLAVLKLNKDLEDETLSKGNERQGTAGGMKGDNEYSNGWKEYDVEEEEERKVRHLTPESKSRGSVGGEDKGG